MNLAPEVTELAHDVSPEEALSRIRKIVMNFIQCVSFGEPSFCPLQFIRRSGLNGKNKILDRYLDGYKGRDVIQIMRVWNVLCMVCKLLESRSHASQREIYYHMIAQAPELFQKQSHVNDSIQEVASLLSCSRWSLGIYASSRGAIVGNLEIQVNGSPEWINCTKLGTSGLSIPGNIQVLDSMVFRTMAKFVLVVEKDAIFQRLSEDQVFTKLPCIVVTAKGFPDLGTRVFLTRLVESAPHLEVLGLFDWNPSGINILNTYKFGGSQVACGSSRYVCNIKWLGIRYIDLVHVPEESCQLLSPRDCSLLPNLEDFFRTLGCMDYVDEIKLMKSVGKKAEIEALYANGYNFLVRFLEDKIENRSFI